MKRKNAATADNFIISEESSAGRFERTITDASADQISAAHFTLASKRPKKGDIEKAIYAHIRAVRALGKKTINTAEIAEALTLSLDEVHSALVSLRNKGVKTL